MMKRKTKKKKILKIKKDIIKEEKIEMKKK